MGASRGVCPPLSFPSGKEHGGSALYQRLRRSHVNWWGRERNACSMFINLALHCGAMLWCYAVLCCVVWYRVPVSHGVWGAHSIENLPLFAAVVLVNLLAGGPSIDLLARVNCKCSGSGRALALQCLPGRAHSCVGVLLLRRLSAPCPACVCAKQLYLFARVGQSVTHCTSTSGPAIYLRFTFYSTQLIALGLMLFKTWASAGAA